MRDYAGSALLMAITTLVGIGCYATTAHGAAERDAIQKMRRQLVSDGRAIRDLEAELRTRARLPQLERWNQDVLKMSAPSATQFMRSPVQLASLVNPAPVPAAEPGPTIQYAIAPAAAPAAPAGVVQARFRADVAANGPQRPANPARGDAAPARLVLTGFGGAPANATPAGEP
ncbi:hypothetical protein [Polymorphobacter sp.]|uniref:hypothetical protein n=1 Tax=Polymorphobacter sp. TaxID=1909290 RepID=UPI003F70B6CE